MKTIILAILTLTLTALAASADPRPTYVSVVMDSFGIPFFLDAKGAVWAFSKAYSMEDRERLPEMSRIKNIAPYIALRDDGQVFTWELDRSLSKFPSAEEINAVYTVPKMVPGVERAIAVAAADNHYLALLADGHVIEWGRPLLSNDRSKDDLPHVVPKLENVRAIATSAHTSVALTEAGEIYGWGRNEYGQLGELTPGESKESSAPKMFASVQNSKAVFLTATHSILLSEDGSVRYWGGCSKYGFPDPQAFVSNYAIDMKNIADISPSVDDNHWPDAYLDREGHIWLGYAPTRLSPSTSGPCPYAFSGEMKAHQVIGIDRPTTSLATIGDPEKSHNLLAIDSNGTLWSASFPRKTKEMDRDISAVKME